nr:unnamed protein product [Callosobruchus analis]
MANSTEAVFTVPEKILVGDSRQISLGCWNASSIKRAERFEIIKAALGAKNLDIVGLTETWLTTEHTDCSKKLNGYKLYRKDYAINPKDRGGVCLYIRDSEVIKDVIVLPINANEQLFVKIEWKDEYDLVVGVVYHHVPVRDKYKPFVNALRQSLNAVKEYSSNIICVGDVNIDFLANSPATEYFKTMLTDLGYDQVVDRPTHYTSHSQKLIDVILCTRGRISVSGVVVEDPPIIPPKQYHMFLRCKFRIKNTNSSNGNSESDQEKCNA